MKSPEQIKKIAERIFPELQNTRRQLHQYPELSFQEFNTAAFISKFLHENGITFKEYVAGTGIIASVTGKNPGSKSIILRADIDALPIQELNETSYKSKNIGVMHACGHDAHTTCVLGAALILNELKTELEGTVHFLFQPGEEKLPGGASKIINEGWLDTLKADTILGQHVEPEMEVGKIGIKSGIFMASADEIYITVKGKGGHGAKPHQCIDPILISSHLIVSLQQIVSRNADPLVPSVLTFGKITSNGGATNVIPDSVHIQGTFRTFDENWRKEAHRLIRTMTEQLCKSMGAETEINIMVGYPYLKNDEKITSIVKNRAEEYLGKENVLELPARMGAEDFAFYSQIMPACFYRLGTKNPNGTGLHSATFDIDENALSIGAGLMAWLAFE